MNYPCGIKKNYQKQVSHGNRGMNLEFEINESNKYYLNKEIAVIHKKPTPITIVKVDYKSRVDAVIKEAYFKTPSTTDYNGIYRGKYIDFEAKETTNSKYFPLANIHKHQIEHLKKIQQLGGIGFLIIRFNKLNQTFYLDINVFLEFLEQEKRKSIPLSFFEQKGYKIKTTFRPYIDYLKIVDQLYFGGNI